MKSESNTGYQILLFYKYTHIAEPEKVRDWFRALCEKYDLRGRLIIATEGINITLEGTTEHTEQFIEEMQQDERFLNIHMKRSVGDGKAFRKLSVKTRSEIVSAHLGVCDIDPNEMTGKRCTPQMLHEWIAEKKEFYIVDMRNVYEHKLGHFEGSILPDMENFRDLPKITKALAHLKNKTVLTVCTGGVRCEKASGYLISQGFTDVYQLDGGIVSYMEQYPNEDFKGKLYVFDNRVGMGFYTDDANHEVIGTCEGCGEKCERFVNCDHAWCGKHFILCEECEGKQKNNKGMKTCPPRLGETGPGTCRMRHPNKIGSKSGRFFGRIRQFLTSLWTR